MMTAAYANLRLLAIVRTEREPAIGYPRERTAQPTKAAARGGLRLG